MIFGFGEKKEESVTAEKLVDDLQKEAEENIEALGYTRILPKVKEVENLPTEIALSILENEILKKKNLKLKQLLLLTDPKVAHVHMGNLQLIQWIEFTKVFRDEKQEDIYDQDKRNNNYV